jgi:hypothetical protein
MTSPPVVERHRRERLWVIGFLWLSAASGIAGAILGIALTIAKWPNVTFLLLTVYGSVHAAVSRALAVRI